MGGVVLTEQAGCVAQADKEACPSTLAPCTTARRGFAGSRATTLGVGPECLTEQARPAGAERSGRSGKKAATAAKALT